MDNAVRHRFADRRFDIVDSSNVGSNWAAKQATAVREKLSFEEQLGNSNLT
jgi:hypothetical protein